MEKDRMNDRHGVPKPKGADVTHASGTVVTGDADFLDGFKERIHDLFKTEAGLPKHTGPIQDLFKSLSKSPLPDDRKKLVAVKVYDQLKKAAEHATFDFEAIHWSVDSVNWKMSLARQKGKVITTKS
jgi:hypothetical protein